MKEFYKLYTKKLLILAVILLYCTEFNTQLQARTPVGTVYGPYTVTSTQSSGTFSSSGVYEITGNSGSITVTGGTSSNPVVLILTGITRSGTTPQLQISGSGYAVIYLASGKTNTFTCTCSDVSTQSPTAGIYVPTGTTLRIEGEGTLNANGGLWGAGIGGSGYYNSSFSIVAGLAGTIIINSGTVNAKGGVGGADGGSGAGIGGGRNGNGGNITLNGGTITAIGGDNASGNDAGAGIGSGGAQTGSTTGATMSISSAATIKAYSKGSSNHPAIHANGSVGGNGFFVNHWLAFTPTPVNIQVRRNGYLAIFTTLALPTINYNSYAFTTGSTSSEYFNERFANFTNANEHIGISNGGSFWYRIPSGKNGAGQQAFNITAIRVRDEIANTSITVPVVDFGSSLKYTATIVPEPGYGCPTSITVTQENPPGTTYYTFLEYPGISATWFTYDPNTCTITLEVSGGTTFTGDLVIKGNPTGGSCSEEPTLFLNNSTLQTCYDIPGDIIITGNTFGGSATAIESIVVSGSSGGTATWSAPGSPFTITYVPVPSDEGETITLTVTTNNPNGSPCEAAEDTLTILFNPKPEKPKLKLK